MTLATRNSTATSMTAEIRPASPRLEFALATAATTPDRTTSRTASRIDRLASASRPRARISLRSSAITPPSAMVSVVATPSSSP